MCIRDSNKPPRSIPRRIHSLIPLAILTERRFFSRRVMALTPSTMLALGTPLPAFDLPLVSAGRLNSKQLMGKPVLLMVICAHCPFVKHVEPELTRLEQDFAGRVQLVGVSSNSLITHPQDGPEQLADQARRHGWQFPYLLDEQQSLARDLRAACTPEFYVFCLLYTSDAADE